jgi:hypothetical protein
MGLALMNDGPKVLELVLGDGRALFLNIIIPKHY